MQLPTPTEHPGDTWNSKRAPRPFFGIVAAVCLLLSVGLLAFTEHSRSPISESMLTVEPEIEDFGPQPQQKLLRTRIVLHNRCPAPLEILRVETGCACAAAVVGTSHIPPSSSSVIQASLQTLTYRGPIQQHVDIVYRLVGGVQEHRQRFFLVATVLPEYEVSPTVLTFDQDKEETQEVVVASPAGASIGVKSAYPSHKAFDVDLGSLSADERVSVIRVRFDPAKWTAGSHGGTLQLNMTSANEPVHVLKIRVR